MEAIALVGSATAGEDTATPAVFACLSADIYEHPSRREWTVAEQQAVDVAFASAAASAELSPFAVMVLVAASVHTMKNIVLAPGCRDEKDAADEQGASARRHRKHCS